MVIGGDNMITHHTRKIIRAGKIFAVRQENGYLQENFHSSMLNYILIATQQGHIAIARS